MSGPSGERVEVGIRDATSADLPEMAAILNHEIAASPYVYAEEPVTLEERRAWFDAHRGFGLPVLVAVADANDDAVLGWASLSPYRASSGYRHTSEASVYVAQSARGRGVGAAILGALLAAPPTRSYHAFVASIDADNLPSIKLFERFGFREAGRLPEVGRKFDEWRTQLLYLLVRRDGDGLGPGEV